MASRPLVGVYSGDKKVSDTRLPSVFLSPIRNDVVQEVHSRMAKNKRQPYAVSKFAGHQTSAESWGTGRAVARIPRVSGGGTHRAGQGAFGNMCRGGRMFAPTKIWRRWHRKINTNEKRFALVSSLAASAIPALVMARGHKIEQIPEIPLVIDNKSLDHVEKTKKAIEIFKQLRVMDDVEKVKESKHIRAGKGKARNRRFVQRRGPLVIYNQAGSFVKAFRDLPGVEFVNVTRLNLLQLAPGGHLGRFCIWLKDAFERLDSLYGTTKRPSAEKVDYRLPRPMLTNADVTRIMNSEEIHTFLRPRVVKSKLKVLKKNPLTNIGARIKLDPYARSLRRRALLAQERAAKRKAELVQQKRSEAKKSPLAEKIAQKRKAAKKRSRTYTKQYRAFLAS